MRIIAKMLLALGWVEPGTDKIHWLKQVDYTVGQHTVIYGLLDPLTKELRYVGMTKKDPVRRLRQHLRFCQSRNKDGEWVGNNYNYHWLRFLLREGQKPVMSIIDVVAAEEGGPAEAAYISLYEEEGCQLTNMMRGGEGGSQLPEVREKIRRALWKFFSSPAGKVVREKQSQAKQRFYDSPAGEKTREKMRRAKLKLFASPAGKRINKWKIAESCAWALKLKPVVEEIRESGITTLKGIAEQLNKLGHRTRTGKRWRHLTVWTLETKFSTKTNEERLKKRREWKAKRIPTQRVKYWQKNKESHQRRYEARYQARHHLRGLEETLSGSNEG